MTPWINVNVTPLLFPVQLVRVPDPPAQPPALMLRSWLRGTQQPRTRPAVKSNGCEETHSQDGNQGQR